jgi:ribosomal protein S25
MNTHQEAALGEAMLKFENQQVRQKKRPDLPNEKRVSQQAAHYITRTRHEQVLDLFTSDETEITFTNVAEHLGVSNPVASTILSNMHKRNQVAKTSMTRQSITANGKLSRNTCWVYKRHKVKTEYRIEFKSKRTL